MTDTVLERPIPRWGSGHSSRMTYTLRYGDSVVGLVLDRSVWGITYPKGSTLLYTHTHKPTQWSLWSQTKGHQPDPSVIKVTGGRYLGWRRWPSPLSPIHLCHTPCWYTWFICSIPTPNLYTWLSHLIHTLDLYTTHLIYSCSYSEQQLKTLFVKFICWHWVATEHWETDEIQDHWKGRHGTGRRYINNEIKNKRNLQGRK